MKYHDKNKNELQIQKKKKNKSECNSNVKGKLRSISDIVKFRFHRTERLFELRVGGGEGGSSKFGRRERKGANIDNSNHVVGAVLLFPVAFWEE